jgi:hypothetical protein
MLQVVCSPLQKGAFEKQSANFDFLVMSRNIRGTHIAKKFKAPYDLAVSDNSNRLSNETQVQLAEFSKKIQQNPYGRCILRYAILIQVPHACHIQP